MVFANKSEFYIDQITDVKVESVDYFVVADFSRLGKLPSVQVCVDRCHEVGFVADRWQVSAEVTLTAQQWNAWICDLLSEQPWLKGKGGYSSTFETAKKWHMLTGDELEQFQAGAYHANCILVKCGWVKVVVDPQGYGYAVYTGLNVRPE